MAEPDSAATGGEAPGGGTTGGGTPWGELPVGTVAEEAARLVDAFAAWAGHAGDQTPTDPAPPYADGAPGVREERTPSTGSPPSGAGPSGGTPSGGAASGGAASGGATSQSSKESCRSCPVCRGIGWLRAVNPETVDQIADLAGVVASGLRDFAAHSRRGRADGSAPGRSGAGAAGAEGGGGAERGGAAASGDGEGHVPRGGGDSGVPGRDVHGVLVQDIPVDDGLSDDEDEGALA